jgi:AraC family transcriptional regulator
MSERLRILHGPFGRVALLLLDETMVVHAHCIRHVIFRVGGPDILFGVCERQHPLSDKNVALVNAWEPNFYTRSKDLLQVASGALSGVRMAERRGQTFRL